MDLKTAIKATDFAFHNLAADGEQKHLSIMFFGGEPLLNWGFVTQFTEWLLSERPRSRFSYTLELFTNGVLLDQEKIDFLLGNDIRMYLSLDGDFEDQQVRRPMSHAQFDGIISAIRSLVVRRRPAQTDPWVYAVVRADRRERITDLLQFFHDLGIRQVQLSRDLSETFTDDERERLVVSVMAFIRKHADMNVLFNPESACDCTTCRPKAILVYPNGDVFDLCSLCVFHLFLTGRLTREEFDVFFLGNLSDIRQVCLDLEAKKRVIGENFCPTVHRQRNYLEKRLNP
jgi:sulfatase maturation enzyme AslB (radical SAM superfamily)